MKKVCLVVAVALLASLASAAGVSARWGGRQEARLVTLREGVAWQRSQAWHWQDLAGVPRSRTAYTERRETSTSYLRWAVRLWNGRRDAAYRAYRKYAASRPAHYQGWMCIHRGEGSWNDTGDPFWGGLQMHPGWGYGTSYHASDDSPMEQMWAAERGYQASGYSHAWLAHQWPNTYPPCAGHF